jgi:hypothetical protein
MVHRTSNVLDSGQCSFVHNLRSKVEILDNISTLYAYVNAPKACHDGSEAVAGRFKRLYGWNMEPSQVLSDDSLRNRPNI